MEIYNIGNNKPVKLMDYIHALEKSLNKKAKIKFLPLQQVMSKTPMLILKILKNLKYKPITSVSVGVKNFVQWYKSYYKLC